MLYSLLFDALHKNVLIKNWSGNLPYKTLPDKRCDVTLNTSSWWFDIHLVKITYLLNIKHYLDKVWLKQVRLTKNKKFGAPDVVSNLHLFPFMDFSFHSFLWEITYNTIDDTVVRRYYILYMCPLCNCVNKQKGVRHKMGNAAKKLVCLTTAVFL